MSGRGSPAVGLLAAAAALLVCGCSGVRVVVKDPNGRPIPGAEVAGVTLSMNGAPVLTDARGEARVPWMAQELKWVSVRRDGYCPIPEVPVREARPVTVVLPPHRREDGPCPTVLERLMHGTAP